MANVLDFGAGEEGLVWADWLDESWSIDKHPYGHTLISCSLGRSCKTIPVPDQSYDMIHCKDSICWNGYDQWRVIFSEFKRILRPGGMIVITDSLNMMAEEDTPPEFRYVDEATARRNLMEAFEGYHVVLNTGAIEEDTGYMPFNAVIYDVNL